MKELLSIFLRRLALSLLLAALGVGALLLARGEGGLTFALLLGFAAALVFVWNMAWRLWHLATAPGTARRQMLWGMALRLAVPAVRRERFPYTFPLPDVSFHRSRSSG